MNKVERVKVRRLMEGSVGCGRLEQTRAQAHLISYLSAPFYHLRYRLLVEAAARLSDGVNDSEIALNGVESSYRILRGVSDGLVPS